MTPIQKPSQYLDEIAAGIKIATPTDLPSILREIAINLNVLADEAETYLTPPAAEPDDW